MTWIQILLPDCYCSFWSTLPLPSGSACLSVSLLQHFPVASICSVLFWLSLLRAGQLSTPGESLGGHQDWKYLHVCVSVCLCVSGMLVEGDEGKKRVLNGSSWPGFPEVWFCAIGKFPTSVIHVSPCGRQYWPLPPVPFCATLCRTLCAFSDVSGFLQTALFLLIPSETVPLSEPLLRDCCPALQSKA